VRHNRVVMQILMKNKLRQRFFYIIDYGQLKSSELKIIRTETKNAIKKHKNEDLKTTEGTKDNKKGSLIKWDHLRLLT
ncbi:MAG TPA: hypothetical protein VJ602_10075, partial [Paludibacter sp.]|nr:hypothetical protein [Paludibacter sp.]